MKTFFLTIGFIIGYTLIMGFYLILFRINPIEDQNCLKQK